jgi:hypothetical protein
MKQSTEPLFNVADFFYWAIQNMFEKGNVKYYIFLNVMERFAGQIIMVKTTH